MAISEFKIIPWRGGLNLATDSNVLVPEQVVIADNIIQDTDEIKKKREGVSYFDADVSSNIGESLIGLFDYWRTDNSGVKAQLTIAVSSNGNIYEYDDVGARTTLTNAGNVLTSPIMVSFEVMNDILIMGFDGTANTPLKYNPDDSTDVQDLGGSPPNFSLVRQHFGRLWVNDKTNPERLGYTSTGNIEEWNGTGDSGALDIFPGDGDPEGITGIFPTFKGSLFVGKLTKLYEISGFTPETYRIILVSNGIGVASHASIVPVDQNDIMFASERGFHALSSTIIQGSFENSFISREIQPRFNSFQAGRKKFITGVYIPSFNSLVWAVSEEGNNNNRTLYLWNLITKQWYRWPALSCQSLMARSENFTPRLYLGTNDARILKTQSGNFKDTLSSVNASPKLGTDLTLGTSKLGILDIDFGINYALKTGTVYPDNNPRALKNFTGITIFIKPKGTYSLSAKVVIDNNETQSFTITDTQLFDLLGTTFILGTSELGSGAKSFPVYRTIDGIGYGVTIELTENTVDADMQILGYGIGFDPIDEVNEVIINP